FCVGTELSIVGRLPSSSASSGAGGPLHTHRRASDFEKPLLSTCPGEACSWQALAAACLLGTGDVVGSLGSSGPRPPCPASARPFGCQPPFVGPTFFGGGLCSLLSSGVSVSCRYRLVI